MQVNTDFKTETMKFAKKEPKEKWPAQKVYHRMSFVKRDIAEINREMIAIDGAKRDLEEKKKALIRKITNKWKYFRQLNAQLKETLQTK